MSNIYLKVTIETFSKLRFSRFKIFLTIATFWETLTDADINEFETFLLELKNQLSGSKTVCGFFYYFNFERNYDILKSNSPWILLKKKINFNENETELKMENSTNLFRETNLARQLIWESQIRSKTVMSCSSRRKKEGSFCASYFVQREFL